MTRDEAIKELQLIAKITMWNDRREAVEMAIEALNTDIVRCWECKKQFTNDCYMIYGKNMMRNLFDNDFCSYGEREESEVEE